MRKVPALAMAIFAAAACADDGLTGTTDAQAARGATGGLGAHGTGNVVEITARGHTLVVPAEIPSGWTTLRLRNESGMEHFAILQRMPDGRTLADSKAEVVPVFQDALDLINQGRTAEAFAEFARLPAWYADVVFFGGPGLVAPGGTAVTSLYLEPGTYVVECYVKTNGRFHSADGMIEQVVVTAAAGGGREPKAALGLTLSNAGFAVDGALRPGLQTIRVHFAEQTTHENALGTDVHLVRLEPDTDLDALAGWMNWVAVDGLATPAPAEFLGGTHEMPAGSTAYVTAQLTPGRYAFVAEVPDPAGKGMLHTFTVPGDGSR